MSKFKIFDEDGNHIGDFIENVKDETKDDVTSSLVVFITLVIGYFVLTLISKVFKFVLKIVWWIIRFSALCLWWVLQEAAYGIWWLIRMPVTLICNKNVPEWWVPNWWLPKW